MTALPPLPHLEAFCRTYELGSFTRAARALALTPQAVSRSVARLEEELGATLFRRTTRSLAATDEGRRYYEHAAQAIALLRAGGEAMREKRNTPSGLVRISVPTTYGLSRFAPRLGEFQRLNPHVQVEMQVSNHNVDFVRDGCDLAIRHGTIADHSLVARRLGTFPLAIVASPAYLARRGRPHTPDDLASHDCITFVLPRTGRAMPWSVGSPPRRIEPLARYRCAEDMVGVVALARAGLGLAHAYVFMFADHVRRGELVEVLEEHRGASRPFSLVYPRATARSSAVRAMIEFIVATREP
ncbi:LysR family transcriptional regulator [Sandaracinus amylolyticus]|uniref:Transcriptional regulator, LysR family protein n=1 Tax=Sandaracinus amylolyticus TaxID=927083 RepID=A0A0F6W9T5_9BACT|nr:LysR family transcriptional regulator [Sandaracinus amylolyticus]AKF11087.1 Transcriptional regulator, LysR family protein [Sandaracinus amylolyticus]